MQAADGYIMRAKQSGRPEFVFEGSTIQMVASCSVFATIRLDIDSSRAKPVDLAALMSNVAVFVEDQKPGSPRLLGLYEGVPLTARGHYYSGHLPDRITIFRKPIQRQCATRE